MPILSGVWITATIEVTVLTGKFTFSRPQIVNESFVSHTQQGRQTMPSVNPETGVTTHKGWEMYVL